MQITDKELHQKFIRLGADRRKLTNQLLAILPEIFERKIYRKYAATIEEYAGKFAGLGKGVVKKRLRLEKYLKDKPNLKAAIATEGVHKIALVASLATAENEAALADKLGNMSKSAVQELSKELRNKIQKGELIDNNQSLFGTNLCSAAPQRIKIDLEGDLFFMFLKLKKKYGEQLNNLQVMKKIFEENLGMSTDKNARNSKNGQPKSVKVIPGDRNSQIEFQDAHEKCDKEKIRSNNKIQRTKSRYISIRLRRNFLEKTDGKCTYPDCNRPVQIFHHTERFAKSRSHESVRPFCKIHHEFAHNGLIANENLEIQNWQLQLQTGELDKIDQLYRQYRSFH